MAITGFDPSVLLNYYAAKLPFGASLGATAQSRGSHSGPIPPWDLSVRKLPKEKEDVAARSGDPYFDPKDRTLLAKADAAPNAGSQLEALLQTTLAHKSASASANPGLEADNDRLFALYKALNRLDYIAKMANRDETTNGLRPGLDNSFQDGLDQILAFVNTAEFSNLTVLPSQKSSTVQSGVAIAYQKANYTGGPAVGDKEVFTAIPNVTAADSFTVSITKAGVKTDVAIDLANVTGALTLDNINAYVNQQLSSAGFGTRFARVQTGGSIVDGTASWGTEIRSTGSEIVALSSPQSRPAVYVAGTSGKSADQQGRLIKLTDLDGNVASQFSANMKPVDGTASAKAAATDSNGNIYVVGNTSGSFGSEINQGSQDVFLTKYDSAGNLLWTKLLGSAESANAYSLAVDPASGGVAIAGSVTGDLKPTAIGGGTDSFVAKYDSDGNQAWLRQVAPASNDQANAISIDASGNIYVGGQVNGAIAAGQTNAGGTDAYLTKLNSQGTLVYHRQFGGTGEDAARQMAIAADGNVVVASVENGHAILTKYNSADGTSAALWQVDLGDLQGGSVGGLTIAGGEIYLSGTTSNAALDAGGAASVVHASSGGRDAFVFSASDSGGSVTPDFVSYVGTGVSEQGGGVAVTNGKIYLTGTTTGTFPGQTPNAASAHNLFVAQLDASGNLNWARQYGGFDGESQGLAIVADNAGASVLDALKLPRGTLHSNPSNQLESQTTVRAGDTFTLKVESKTGTRETKITIAKGETLRSLAVKINGALLFDGKATALPIKGGQGLKLAINEGVQVQLIAGPKDFDALAGLGMKPQTLVHDASAEKDKSSSVTIGLGIDGKLDLLSKATAAHVHVVLQGAMALIKQAYGTLNAPPGANTPVQTGGGSAYQQSRFANYQTALAWMNLQNGQG